MSSPSNTWVVYRYDINKVLLTTQSLTEAEGFMVGYKAVVPTATLRIVRPWIVPGYVEPVAAEKPTTGKRRGRKRALR